MKYLTHDEPDEICDYCELETKRADKDAQCPYCKPAPNKNIDAAIKLAFNTIKREKTWKKQSK